MIRRPAKSSHKDQERGTVMQNQAYEQDFNTFEKKDPAIQGAAGSPYNEEPLYFVLQYHTCNKSSQYTR